jgi:serine/threonine protein kinase
MYPNQPTHQPQTPINQILSTQTAFAKTVVGTPYYLSPELCEDKPYNEKSDVSEPPADLLLSAAVA